jgi:hypothetical protein
MKRRVFLLFALAACARPADPAGEVVDLFTDVAASLSAGNVKRFLAAFDPAMPGYATLREDVTGLVAQGEVQSFLDPLVNEGSETRRSVEWAWTLRIRRGQDATSGVVREETVKAQVEKRSGKWRIVQLEPPRFFASAK